MLHSCVRSAAGSSSTAPSDSAATARALLEAGATRVIGLDRDVEALAVARDHAGALGRSRRARARRLSLARRSARRAATSTSIDGALADLGVSSLQLDAEDAASASSAMNRSTCGWTRRRAKRPRDLVARASEARSGRRAFMPTAKSASPAASPEPSSTPALEEPIATTGRLAAIVRRAVPRRGYMRIDPATRTFQALRIWVNRELEGLDRFIEMAVAAVARRRAAGGDQLSLARGSHRQAHAARAPATPRAAARDDGVDEEADRRRRRRTASAIRAPAAPSCAPHERVAHEMAEAFEYAIKKDVRNNPIVREVDDARHRELWKTVAVAGFFVVMLLFWAWQQFDILRHGYRLEEMQRATRRRRRNGPPAAAGNRNAQVAQAHRGAGDPTAASRRADARGSDRDRTRSAGRPAGTISGCTTVIERLRRLLAAPHVTATGQIRAC